MNRSMFEHKIEFENDIRMLVLLRILGARPEVIVPPNGHPGRATVRMTPALDAELQEVIERLIDLRLAYIDDRQRSYQLELPFVE